MLKRFFAFLVSFALITSPLMAEGINSSDLNFAFGQSDTQVSQLSSDLSIMIDQQMSETEGELWKPVAKWISDKQPYGGSVRYDSKAHNFGKRKILGGRRAHIQANIHKKGVKGSGKTLFRIPLWKAK
jgi:hypothetical protein